MGGGGAGGGAGGGGGVGGGAGGGGGVGGGGGGGGGAAGGGGVGGGGGGGAGGGMGGGGGIDAPPDTGPEASPAEPGPDKPPSSDGPPDALKTDATPDFPPPTSSAEKYCRDAYDKLLNLISGCTGISYDVLASLFLDIEYRCDEVEKSIAAGRMSFDATEADKCLKAIDEVTCDDLDDPTMMISVIGCDKGLAGKVAVDGPCYGEAGFNECTAGNYCLNEMDCPGKCAYQPKEGEDCPDGACADGSSCSGAGKCVADAGLGKPCMGPDAGNCKGGLYCDGGDSMTAGACASRKTGGSCAGSDECVTGYECRMGTCVAYKRVGDACMPGKMECNIVVGYCDASSKKCSSYPGPGGSCGFIGGELVICVYGYCEGASIITPGTCKPFKAPGDACDPMSPFPQCTPHAECDGATTKCVDRCVAP